MARTVQYNHVVRGDDKNITVVVDGEMYVADGNHPQYDQIVLLAQEDDPEVVNLFDATKAVADTFEKLSERVSVANSRVYFDNDEIEDVYADLIVRFLQEGQEDWKPLVNFLELAMSNIEEHTRENLSRWLKATGGFEIDKDGYILGYKGLTQERGSIHRGPAIVNGKAVNGSVPNEVGSVIEMQRSAVEHNPAVACSVGLHVGTWEYASGFGSVVAKVRVNPRDVVSVPTDCYGQKMRVSRYEVLEFVNGKTNAAYVPVEDNYDEGDVDDYDDYEDEPDYYEFPNDGYTY